MAWQTNEEQGPPATHEAAEEHDAPRRSAIALPTYPVRLTPLLLAANILMFAVLSLASRFGVMESVLGGADTRTLVAFGAKANSLIARGEYWRLLTAIFLHIGLIHLLFNSYALNLFGREVERLYGWLRFGVVYFLSGIAGSLLSFAFSPNPAAGASGAIFGIIGSLAAFVLRNRALLGEAGRRHLRGLMGMIGINLFLGFTLPGVDNYGHIGGLIAGFALGLLLSPRYALQPLQLPPFGEIISQGRSLPALAVALLGLLILSGLFVLVLPFAPT